MAIHEFSDETVRLEKFEPGAKVKHDPHPGGEEILVLEGVLKDENGVYPSGTWLRQPDGQRISALERRGLCNMGKARASVARMSSQTYRSWIRSGQNFEFSPQVMKRQ
jgi:hypothetical protein